MSLPHLPDFSRNARLRRRRATGHSLRRLAREFGVSATRVVQVLRETGGDPLATGDAEAMATRDLEAECVILRQRIEADRGSLREYEDILEARRTDRILGFA